MKNEDSENFDLEKINEFLKLYFCKSKILLEMSSNGFYPMDFLALAVMKRSLNLINIFCICVKERNYLTAASLLRLQLDSFMRFAAAWLVEDQDEFARKILRGDRIDKIKDKNGKKMKDKYLVDIFSLKYEWIRNVYESTSGFIHLSGKHIFALIKEPFGAGKKEPQVFGLEISYRDSISEEFWYELCHAFCAINSCLLEYVDKHLSIKKNKPYEKAVGVLYPLR